jgi:hypothetical protein
MRKADILLDVRFFHCAAYLQMRRDPGCVLIL